MTTTDQILRSRRGIYFRSDTYRAATRKRYRRRRGTDGYTNAEQARAAKATFVYPLEPG